MAMSCRMYGHVMSVYACPIMNCWQDMTPAKKKRAAASSPDAQSTTKASDGSGSSPALTSPPSSLASVPSSNVQTNGEEQEEKPEKNDQKEKFVPDDMIAYAIADDNFKAYTQEAIAAPRDDDTWKSYCTRRLNELYTLGMPQSYASNKWTLKLVSEEYRKVRMCPRSGEPSGRQDKKMKAKVAEENTSETNDGSEANFIALEILGGG